MKTLLLALVLVHTGCAAVATETETPVNPVSAQVSAPQASASATQLAALSNGGYAVAVRQRDAILVGTLDQDRKPLGALARIPARHVIGTPTVAANGEVAMVTWAQGETSGCTSLVGVTFAPGELPGPAHRIAGTECTEERSARAPVLSSTPEGQFLLAFTEIGVWSSQPVAMVLKPARSGDLISRLGP